MAGHRSTGMTAAGAAAEPIAVVGIGCRLPGADHPDGLWELLLAGRDEITTIPADRFDVDAYFDPTPATPGRTHSRWGGFVRNLRGFDAPFFGISPREAERMDPQQRLLLETAWDGLRDAGIAPRSLAGSRTGVYMGMIASNYRDLQDRADLNVYSVTGTSYAVLTGRLSFQLGLRGPSLTLDTACSSSLVAVHLACQSLRSGESEMAIAGGVNAVLLPDEGVAYSSARMLSTHGRCKFADTDGDGFVRSDGVGVVILKRLSQAVKDGDRVYAVIAGSACNNDGQGSGFLLTPAESGQVDLLRSALRDSGLRPGELDYVEAHGTGTSVGDAVELRALTAVMSGHRTPDAPCLVGSIKSNIGHTEAAAGIAGLIKVALSLHHGRIPASLHLENLNPAIDWKTAPLRVPTTSCPWPSRPDSTATAGVSAFGISGTNAHVVLRRPDPAPVPRGRPTGTLLLPVSAATRAACHALTEEYARVIAESRPADVRRLCAAAARRSDHYTHRIAVSAPDPEALAVALTGAVSSGADAHSEEPTPAPSPVFVFPGQGSQWIGMGRDLMRRWPLFRNALRECDKAIREETDWSVLDMLAQGTNEDLDRVDVVQPLLWAMQVAIARLWQSFGITPRAVIGHSMGEVAAAHISGALSLTDAARIICRRSRAAATRSGVGAMAVLGTSAAEAEHLLAGRSDGAKVCVAAHNSPRSTVVSGDADAVATLVQHATSVGTAGHLIRVDFASHSPHMDPLREGIVRELDDLDPGPTRIRMHSTVFDEDIDGTRLDSGYWADNLRRPVKFAEGVAKLAAEEPTLFIEVSPHPVLLSAINDCLAPGAGRSSALASVIRDEAEESCIADRVAHLYSVGMEIDWSAFYPGPAPHADLPRYPWDHEDFWAAPAAERLGPAETEGFSETPLPEAHHHPLLCHHEEHGPVHRWQGAPDTSTLERIAAHRVQGISVFPATAYLELAQAAYFHLHSEGTPLEMRDVRFHNGLYLQSTPPTLRTDLDTSQAEWTFAISSAQPDDTWLVHASGTLSPAHSAPPVAVDLDAAFGRCATELSGADFYALSSARGNDWGGDFRCLTHLWTGPGELLAILQAPAQPGQGSSPYRFDPAFLDAGCHVLAALVDQLDPSDSRGAFLGTLIETARFYRGPESKLLTHAVLHRGADGTLRGDIHLLTVGGSPVADLIGVTSSFVHQLDTPVAQQPPVGESAEQLLRVDWQEAPHPLPGDQPPGHWLLLTDDGAAAQHLRSGLPGSVTVLPVGGGGEKAGSAGVLQDHQLLVAQTGLGVVFLPAPDHHRRWERAADNPCHQLARLIRTLESSRTPARLWIVTRSAQAALSDDAVSQPAAATLWGMARTAILELPELHCTLIDLPEQPGQDSWRQLVRELVSDPGESQVALRNGRRLVPRLRPAVLPTPARPANPNLLIRPDAGYLVTGGLGALGRLATQWLLDHGARDVLLAGRSTLPPPSRAGSPDGQPLAEAAHALRTWQDQGLHVEYRSIDVADSAALTDLFHQWRDAGHPRIRGVLHTAGIAMESALAELSEADLDELLRAKLQGGWALHRTIGAEPLDFFALYSSAASVISSPTLGGYAGANAALDALADHRKARGLPAVSIQWGFWNEVGMDARQEARIGRTRKPTGIRGFTPEQGISVLSEILTRHTRGQIMVMPADWRTWAAAYPQAAAVPLMSNLVSPPAPPTTPHGGRHRVQPHDRPATAVGQRLVNPGQDSTVESGPAVAPTPPPRRVADTPGPRARAEASPTTAEDTRRPVSDRSDAVQADSGKGQDSLGEKIVGIVAQVVGIKPPRLPRHRPLNRIGLDSLMATEVSTRIRRELGVDVPLISILRGATLDDVITAAQPGTSAPTPPGPASRQL